VRCLWRALRNCDGLDIPGLPHNCHFQPPQLREAGASLTFSLTIAQTSPDEQRDLEPNKNVLPNPSFFRSPSPLATDWRPGTTYASRALKPSSYPDFDEWRFLSFDGLKITCAMQWTQ